jgi:hypothetical protein
MIRIRIRVRNPYHAFYIPQSTVRTIRTQDIGHERMNGRTTDVPVPQTDGEREGDEDEDTLLYPRV